MFIAQQDQRGLCDMPEAVREQRQEDQFPPQPEPSLGHTAHDNLKETVHTD